MAEPVGARRKTKLAVSVLGKTSTLEVVGDQYQNLYAGEWQEVDTGYVASIIKGILCQGKAFAEVSSLRLGGAAGNDVIGSFFMVNGYFGMQVNSSEERRILFSVWSPFEADDPASIPEEDRIKLLRKGVEVYPGEFGSEGSGGKSYLKQDWKAGSTYKFLLQGKTRRSRA